MIIFFILTGKTLAGLDIRLKIILRQHKVYDDYLNLPKILSGASVLLNIPQIFMLC